MAVKNPPVMPCWYCDGRDGDGEPYDPRVHSGTRFCDACDERREAQARVAALEGALRQAEEAIEALAHIGPPESPSCDECHGRWPEHHPACTVRAALEAVRRVMSTKPENNDTSAGHVATGAASQEPGEGER